MVIKFIIITLILHFVADFTLQGWLAQAKCKSWWKDMLYDMSDEEKELYRYDYLAALAVHSIYWTLIVFAPVIFFSGYFGMHIPETSGWLPAWLLLQAIFHAVVDNLKANKGRINLIQDQLCHLLQMSVSLILFI